MRYLFLILATFYVGSAFALRPNNVTLFNAQANTTGAKHSVVVDAQQIVSGSIQASFSDGAAAGTLVLECSNDPPSLATSGQSAAPTNWSTCTNGSITASATVASGALTLMSLQWLNSRWLRVTWTRSGGAGTLTVYGMFQAM